MGSGLTWVPTVTYSRRQLEPFVKHVRISGISSSNSVSGFPSLQREVKLVVLLLTVDIVRIMRRYGVYPELFPCLFDLEINLAEIKCDLNWWSTRFLSARGCFSNTSMKGEFVNVRILRCWRNRVSYLLKYGGAMWLGIGYQYVGMSMLDPMIYHLG